eukprot:CAMPEP_0203752092 /NCGR_PEP_ID=MMETSP0098-20131031/6061_1 /ASSEMBLY_ACC=CAM_ASM_000208 /TAXON_ID=96639 /ORGANISM=" , Strain NY0313808BC1" /LENGTH=561 /DNA_ID=CAMNT_0050642095 /DNA_START=707 /DNA_END=2389 /DNA_ORIENTATION=-
MSGHVQACAEWSSVVEFEAICRTVGSFGYGSGWDIKVDEFFAKVSLQKLLQILEVASQDGDLEKIDVICTVLRAVFHSKTGEKQLTDGKFVDSLVQGLGHYSGKVRALSCRQLRRIGLGAFNETDSMALVGALVKSMYDLDTGIAQNAAHALVAFAREDKSSRDLVLSSLSGLSMSDLGNLEVSEKSVVDLRILFLTVRVAAENDQAFVACRENGLLKLLIDIVSGDDVLLQLNALKLIPFISATKEGLAYIVNMKVLTHLERMAGMEDGQEADPFVGEEALRVISQLSARMLVSGQAQTAADLSSKFLKTVARRLGSSQTSDPLSTTTTLEMIGAFAGTQPPQSLEMVIESGLLQRWMQFATAHGDTIKTVGLASIASALRGGGRFHSDENPAIEHQSSDEIEYAALMEETMVQPTEDERKRAAELGKRVFLMYGEHLNQQIRKYPNTTQIDPSHVVCMLVDLLKFPLAEQQCAIYALLRCIAAQDSDWGLNAIYMSGVEVEKNLLDRSLNMSKLAKEWRFAVLEAVYHSPHRDAVLGTQRLGILKTFLKRGPYLGPSTA